MAYASYEHSGIRAVGEVAGDTLIPLRGITEIGPDTTTDVLAAADRDAAAAVPLDAVRLLPVVPNPTKVVCVGLNYRDHIVETKRDFPTYPVMFPKYASSLLGAHDEIALPPESTEIDYEGELAVVIGRPGRRIAEADALNHVLGYTVANDLTMRDYQYKTHQWMQGKAWDASTPVGPTIVTPDEIDITRSGIRTIVNGETGAVLGPVSARVHRRQPRRDDLGVHQAAARRPHPHRHPGRRRLAAQAATAAAPRRHRHRGDRRARRGQQQAHRRAGVTVSLQPHLSHDSAYA